MPRKSPCPNIPGPIFQRELWQNLNGPWAFAFDPADEGISEGWTEGNKDFDRTIVVPFPMGLCTFGS